MTLDKNLDNFIKFCEIINFLDKNNWEYSNNSENWDFSRNLNYEIEPKQNLLWHWLLYIFDRGKKASTFWKTAPPKVEILLNLYFNDNVKTEKELQRIYDCKTGIISDIQERKTGKLKYFPHDNESVYKTLKILLEYEKNIIKYLKDNYDNWDTISEEKNYETPKSNANKMAYLLYKLSFGKRPKVLINGYLWHKRIWAAIRDYIRHNKLNRIFTSGLNNLISTHKVENWIDYFNIKICDLELPGDIWNNRFAKNFFIEFANNFKDFIIEGDYNIKNVIKRNKRKDIMNRPIRFEDFSNGNNYLYPKLLRIFYENLPKSFKNNDKLQTEIIPTQFDISFNFAARMCNENNPDVCKKVCVFGNSGGNKFCTPKSLICPIGFISCGYVIKCPEDYESSCPIFQNKGVNLCVKSRISGK